MATQTLFPSVGSNDNAYGAILWTNPGNVTVNDSVNVTNTLTGASQNTQYLKGLGYGFTIPVGSTIDGIEFTIGNRGKSAGTLTPIDRRVRLVRAGVVETTDKASASGWAGSASIVYGGPTDLWGASWTPADINSSTFGSVLSRGNIPGGPKAQSQVFVDYFSITVHYTAGSATTGAFFTLLTQTR